ncbi:hypothetical protein C8R44DRAFT_788919 [Mycena epipterygia]|nr:hypothetical protein C8R44DRAFT_788919 [Mycena epipterygia]
MPQQYKYSTHALPSPRTSTSPPADFIWLAQKYATLRLEALLTSPNAFASTHAIESQFTAAEWGERIWRDDAVVLVCVAHLVPQDAESEQASPLAGNWVGSAILRGPLPAEEYALAPESGAPPIGSDDEETRWQMTAVFASAAHRGHRLGKMLIQAGKDYAMVQTAKLLAPAKVRLRVMIHPDNLAVLALYSGTGFVDAGRGTGQEAYRTNGDLASWDLKLKSLTDVLKVYWTTQRVAVVMEWLSDLPLEY